MSYGAPIPQSAADVESAVAQYGAAPGGRKLMRLEAEAAQAAIESGVYVTWRGGSADDAPECARVGPAALCLCGHALRSHAAVASSARGARVRAPACSKCACSGFHYFPSRPEECGQWWLPRRKDFDLVAWRKRVRRAPEEYSCIGCDKRVSEHETVFEPEAARRAAGRAVGPAFVPLAESPALQQMVLGADRGVVALQEGGGGGGAGVVFAQRVSLEELFERGAISAAEYRRRLAEEPDGGAPGESGGGGGGGGALLQIGRVAEAPGAGTAAAFPVTRRDGSRAMAVTNIGQYPAPQPGAVWTRQRPPR